jgi:hypothetical protein
VTAAPRALPADQGQQHRLHQELGADVATGGGDRAEHGDRVAGGGLVEEPALGDMAAQDAEQVRPCGLDLDAAGEGGVDEPVAQDGRLLQVGYR